MITLCWRGVRLTDDKALSKFVVMSRGMEFGPINLKDYRRPPPCYTVMNCWSNVFLEEAARDWATCTVSVGDWRRVTEETEGARLFAQIVSGEKCVIAALGTPAREAHTDGIFMPNWMLDHLGLSGTGQPIEVSWLSQEAFPEATRIVLRPHDSAFYHADAKEELERALGRIGVIRRGDTLLIPLECLGGYEVPMDVIETEPANIVLAHGDEVAIEFEEAVDAIVQPEPEPVAPPPAPTGPVGIMLGGEIRYMPDGTRWNPWKHGPWTEHSSFKDSVPK